MLKQRVPETNEGIQGEVTVELFNQYARFMRDRGWNNVSSFAAAGITGGHVLEIGPGPGYIGLEWLKLFPDAELTGIEISPAMIKTAQQNAAEYGFEKKTSYVQGNCMTMPFAACSFDAVFSNGSFHEWEDPGRALNEIYRVLKNGGLFCICDLRRNLSFLKKQMMYYSVKTKEIRPWFISSLNAAYTVPELEEIARKSPFSDFSVTELFSGICIKGKK